MTWNWTTPPEKAIFMDFETVSLCNIRKEGGRAYVNHPSTRISCCAFKWGVERVFWVRPEAVPFTDVHPEGWEPHYSDNPPPRVLERLADGMTLCAQNAASFDKPIWDRFTSVECQWTDSTHFCRAAGLAGGLEKASMALFGLKKNANYALMNTLAVAKVVSGRVVYPICTSAAWQAFFLYCADDVNLLEKVYSRVFEYGQEPDVMRVHQIVNDRGIPVNAAFAARLCTLQEELKVKRADEFAEVTDINAADARSAKKLREWLASINVRLPINDKGKESLDRKELTKLFKNPEQFYDGEDDSELAAALAAIKMRLEITKSTAGKALAIVKSVDDDGRVRDQTVYYGAHTGRWSGRMMQPHNFPKGIKGVPMDMVRVDLTFAEVEELAAKLKVNCSEVIGTLLRPCIQFDEDLSIADYGAIEARGLAWHCDEQHAVDEFRKWDADPYCPMASQIFRRKITKADADERFIGKALILGCGYGMGWRKFVLYCAQYGFNLDEIGVDAKLAVDTYRKAHPNIVTGWARVDAACHNALLGMPTRVCRCNFDYLNGCLRIQLPSGRRLHYRNARIKMEVPAYAKLFAWHCDPQPTIVYDHPHGYDGRLYGGLTMENIVQASMRDVMAYHLVQAEDEELLPVLTVHDEIVCETKRCVRLTELMSTSPPWAGGLPIAVESFRYRFYTKTPPKDAPHFAGLMGEVR